MMMAAPVVAEPFRLETDKTFLASAKVYSDCLNRWLDTLGASQDPVDLVADTVLDQCKAEIRAYAKAMQPSAPLISAGEVYKIVRDGQKKLAMTELVKRRAAAKSSERVNLPEPQTREGKIASCDVKSAEFRQWAAERGGGIRVAAIEEQADDDVACRKAAEALPPVEDWIKTQPDGNRTP